MEIGSSTIKGGCTCGQVRYILAAVPMIVHGCHCLGCQKNSGSAFAINALYEADQVKLVSGVIETISVPTPSGTGQDITRCETCKVAVWSNYNMGGLREHIRFIRVGTLDVPDLLPPDVHIYTESKQSWLTLPVGAQQYAGIYSFSEAWSAESTARFMKVKAAASIQ
ncbi:MAG: hypothetical protein ACI9UN_005098 [Granulosicoccus sp.]|jgi:hypothetical protein